MIKIAQSNSSALQLFRSRFVQNLKPVDQTLSAKLDQSVANSNVQKRPTHRGPLPPIRVGVANDTIVSAHDDIPEGMDELLKARANKPRKDLKNGKNIGPMPPVWIKDNSKTRPMPPQGIGPKPVAQAHDDIGAPADLAEAIPALSSNAQAKLAKLKDASAQVEGLFVKDLFQKMQASIPNTDEKGPYADMANDMFAQAISDSVGKSGGLGISKVLYNNLSKALIAQDAAKNAADSTQINLAS